MELSNVDVFVLSGTLAIPVLAGIFFAVKDKKKYSTENYYFGNRRASIIPVAASLAATAISSISIVAYPVEVYIYGSVFAWYAVGDLASRVIAAVWFIPIYYELKLKSVFEYVELRFNKSLKLAFSFLSCIGFLFYIGLVMYLPALCLSATTSLSIHVALAATSFICTFYTAIGGMKTVIWTDLLQSVMMIAGISVLFIRTVVSVGGLEKFGAAVRRGGRDNFLKFDIDPRIRSSFWTVIIGSLINQCYNACSNQTYVQRYVSCRSTKEAKMALLLSGIPTAILILLCVANGMSMYAFFEHCDPLDIGTVEKIDQTLPYLALKVFQGVPGLTGLFIAAIFSGTLSTVSSGLNSISSLVLHDFILLYYPRMEQRTRILASMGLVIILGTLCTALAYAASSLDQNSATLIYSCVGLVSGPILGVFIMGVVMPWVNSKGAISGFIIGWVCVAIVGFCSFLTHERFSPEEDGGILPFSTEACKSDNWTALGNTSIRNETKLLTNEQLSYFNKNSPVNTTLVHTIGKNTSSVLNPSLSVGTTLLSISFYLYGFLGWMVTIIAANVISKFTGEFDPLQTDWRLFVPAVKKYFHVKQDAGDGQPLRALHTDHVGEKEMCL